MIDIRTINVQRNLVNQYYTKFGFNSKEYNQAFDDLHNLNLQYMAEQYRKTWGFSSNTKTPYC